MGINFAGSQEMEEAAAGARFMEEEGGQGGQEVTG